MAHGREDRRVVRSKCSSDGSRMAAASCCYTRLNTFVAMNISAAQTIPQPSRLVHLGVVALATSPVSSIVGARRAWWGRCSTGCARISRGRQRGRPRRNAIINRDSLSFHVLIREMSRRIFWCSRLTLYVLRLLPLAWREVLCITGALCTLAGCPLGLSGRWCGGLRSTLRHRDGGNAEQRNGKHTVSDRSHVALLHWRLITDSAAEGSATGMRSNSHVRPLRSEAATRMPRRGGLGAVTAPALPRCSSRKLTEARINKQGRRWKLGWIPLARRAARHGTGGAIDTPSFNFGRRPWKLSGRSEWLC